MAGNNASLLVLSGTATEEVSLTGVGVDGGFIVNNENVPGPEIENTGEAEDTNDLAYLAVQDGTTTKSTLAPQVPLAKVNNAPAQYRLIHLTEHPALTDTNRTRLNLGVGEAVDLSGMPDNTSWSVSAGGLSTTNGSPTFTAPSNAATTTVTATVNDKSLQVTFNVKEPSGVDHAVIVSNYSNSYPLGNAGAGMDVNVYIAPTSVSFYRVCIMEVPGPASNITGYFTTNTPPDHGADQGAGEWTDPLTDDNYFGDSAASAPLSPPWVAGGFDWVIPSKWQIKDSAVTNNFTQWTESFRILNSNGDFSTSKFGQTATRTTNNIVTP